MTDGQPSTLIIGVGNPSRRDDGAGVAVARRLKAQLPYGIRVMEASGEGTALLEAWKDADCVFLVDAVQSGAAPGTLHRFAAHEAPIPSHYLHCSTHAFGVAEAVELARALNQLPPQLIVYGIEGKDFSAGVGLTAKIRKAAAAAAVQLLEEMRLLAEAEDSAEPPSKTIPQQVQF